MWCIFSTASINSCACCAETSTLQALHSLAACQNVSWRSGCVSRWIGLKKSVHRTRSSFLHFCASSSLMDAYLLMVCGMPLNRCQRSDFQLMRSFSWSLIVLLQQRLERLQGHRHHRVHRSVHWLLFCSCPTPSGFNLSICGIILQQFLSLPLL